MTVGRVRPAVAAMASYRPGKSAAQAEDEHGITDAIKLASNENPYQPVPAIVAAIAEPYGALRTFCSVTIAVTYLLEVTSKAGFSAATPSAAIRVPRMASTISR